MIAILLMLACSGTAKDTGSAPAAEVPPLDCAVEPDVTWDNWGHAHFTTQCQGCHASQTPNRYGAPAGIHFDTVDAVRAQKDRVYQRVLVDGTMPPAGGLTPDEKKLLEILLACGI